jgi:hypothetical protein
MAAPLIGAGFGVTTSLVNDLSSEYGTLGSPLAGSGWQPVLRVLSFLLDAGWAWAAVAVATGCLAGTWIRGAVAGALALVAAAATYYAVDAMLREEPFSGYWGELRIWWLAGVVLGAALGLIGSTAGRPGPVGVLARLTVPGGAALQMILLPPNGPAAEAGWARGLVGVGAAAAVVVVLARVVRTRRPVGP